MAYTRVQPKALIRLEKDVVTDEEQVEAYLRKERCLRRSEGCGPTS